jgi:hypothetical protein
MAKNKTKTDGKVSDKKLNRLFIERKLEGALSDLKQLVGNKKFERSIKKAGRLLNKDLSKKSLDNFRKLHDSIHAEQEIKEETTMLIEDLP